MERYTIGVAAGSDSARQTASISGTSAQNAGSDSTRANHRHNFIALTLDGLFFWLGISYYSPTTILPLFVSHLTTSNVIVGAVPSIVALSWSLPQLIGARALGRIPSRKGYILRTALVGRVPLVVLVVATALLATRAPEATLVIFFVCYGIFRFTGGLNTPVFYDLVAEVISPRSRAWFIGFSQFLGGAIGALALVGGRALLDAFPFPTGFVICFAIGLVFMTATLAFMAIVREPPGPTQPVPRRRPVAPGAGIVRQAAQMVQEDGAFRGYLVARIFVALASLALAFFAIHAKRELGASDGEVALLSAVLLASQTVTTLVWGAVANRLRLDVVLLTGTVMYLAALVIALVTPSLAWFPLVFGLAGAWLGALAVTDPGLPLAFAEAAGEGRALYVAVANTVLSPFYVIAPLVGGAAADAGGYGLSYALALGAGIIACVLVAFRARVPLTPASPS